MKERIEVLLSAEQIDKRMAELADELYQEFGDEQVELVCALKGAVVTIVDLAKKMKMPVTMNFMSVSSYGNSTESSGNINIKMDLDADITGPSIPMAFGVADERPAVTPDGRLMIPAKSLEGVEIMSANLLLENATDPVIWRGPVIAGAVKQFWTETLWQDGDYMFVDMPPGTGDVPLTVFQSLPVDGIIIVTSPQELVSMIVAKAVNMAKKMDIPILGVVENMSYLECPDCKKHIHVFGESHVEQAAQENGLKVLAQIPIDPKIAQMVDGGRVEYIEMPWFEKAAEAVEAL